MSIVFSIGEKMRRLNNFDFFYIFLQSRVTVLIVTWFSFVLHEVMRKTNKKQMGNIKSPGCQVFLGPVFATIKILRMTRKIFLQEHISELKVLNNLQKLYYKT